MEPNVPSVPNVPEVPNPSDYHLFKRQIKVDDYLDTSPQNTVTITESSHPMYGTGSKVWQSSVFLAKALSYLNEQKVYPLQNKTVVELGCGAGLLSVFLAALGAQVYATDLPIVRELIERNISNNRIVVHERVSFLPYNWNDKWQQPIKIDYIVASEPFISKQAIAAFLKTLRNMLEVNGPTCKAFVAFKIKDNDLYRFAASLEQNGLHEQKWNLQDMHPDYADPRTAIYSIQML